MLFLFFSSRFSSFTLCFLHQYLSVLPRRHKSLSVCLSPPPLSLSLSLSLSLFLSLSVSLLLSLISDTFFLSLSVSVYNSLFLSFPVGLFISVFFCSSTSDHTLSLSASPCPSVSFSLPLPLPLSLSLFLSLSVPSFMTDFLLTFCPHLNQYINLFNFVTVCRFFFYFFSSCASFILSLSIFLSLFLALYPCLCSIKLDLFCLSSCPILYIANCICIPVFHYLFLFAGFFYICG